LRAFGLQATADGFDGLGIRPALPAALLAGTAEVVGGFSIAAGLLTPVGLLITAVMTTAIVTVHFRNGIWNADGGFEFNLTLVACAYVVSALGPGSHSLDNAFRHRRLGGHPRVEEHGGPSGHRRRHRRRVGEPPGP
jgi:putative oxidoreductase